MAKTPEVFTYDLDKNLQKDGRWEYSWNSLNQLEKMSLIPTATGTGKARHQVWTFVYDAQGRRVAKRFYEKFGADFAAGDFSEDYYLLEETLFFYDGWNLIAEVNAFTGDMKTYLWGTDLSGSFQGAGGVGGLLAIKDWKTNKTYAVLNDGRGNVTGLVDASSGEQVAKYAYGPFGESVMATGEAREVCPFRFSTKYFDKATGLHYYGYRYYSASTGRWLNRDPIEEEGGVNVYGFVGNDPVNYIDDLGLRTTMTWQSYWKLWISVNNNRNKSKDNVRRRVFDAGCIGITCINIGKLGPDLKNCFLTFSEAQRYRSTKKCLGCDVNGNPAKAVIFSVHYWDDGNETPLNSTTNRIDMSGWDASSRPRGERERGYVNFDFGYYIDNSKKFVHADQYNNPDGKSFPDKAPRDMTVYYSTLEEWQTSYSDFNAEVFCVTCNNKNY